VLVLPVCARATRKDKPMPLCVKQAALYKASALGEDHPRHIEAVRTTENRAFDDSATLSAPDGPTMYLVQMRGRFSPNSWDPFAGNPPLFKWATVLMSAPDCVISSHGVSQSRQHIGRLGPIHRLSK